MNWSDITSGYGSQSFRPIGGLLGLSFGGKRSQFPQYGGMQQQLPAQFAQLFGNGGNTRSAQMMNNYMGGLLSRRTPYMPPQMPVRQQPAAAQTAPLYDAGIGQPWYATGVGQYDQTGA
jgi:hypothetical protein